MLPLMFAFSVESPTGRVAGLIVGGCAMDERLKAVSSVYAPSPLIGQFHNVDPDGQVDVFFIAGEAITGSTVRAVRDVRSIDGSLAIIVLYVGDDREHEAVALEAGADDCFAVFADFSLLQARLRALLARLRRTNRHLPSIQSIDLDLSTHGALVHGDLVPLTPLEYRFLLELRRQRGTVISHEDLEGLLWGEAGSSTRQSLKQLVHRLRLRLGDAGKAITSIHGTGYILK